jgi:glycosyltransferase involved in cell wall biosynthesis
VIAYGAGGALETILPDRTGLLIPNQDPEAWAHVLRDFRDDGFDPAVLRAHALGFDRSRFRRRMEMILAAAAGAAPTRGDSSSQ